MKFDTAKNYAMFVFIFSERNVKLEFVLSFSYLVKPCFVERINQQNNVIDFCTTSTTQY